MRFGGENGEDSAGIEAGKRGKERGIGAVHGAHGDG